VYSTSFADEQGNSALLWALVDISETKQLAEELRGRLERDHLTGVVSREHFTALLQSALDDDRDDRLALLVVDLDDFKDINDAFGHPLGDMFLIASAQRLRRTVGTAGVVGRLGGDEFAVLARNHDEIGASALAERVLTALATLGPVEGHAAAMTASIGIVTTAQGADHTATVLLRDADTAMYVAKRGGGGRAEIFRPEFRNRLLDRQEREAELRRAVTEEQFELHYQPIVDLADGNRISGVEALVRWRHPERGLLPPGPVIELAEETGLIVPLGEWVLRTACRQATAWAAKGFQLRVSVNTSARQLYETDFVSNLRRALAETGAAPDRIVLELTESTLMHSSSLTVLRQIQELGVRIALDDFGTGYSSLSYLQTHPFDMIKVDRSFVLQLGSTTTAEGIVRCVLQLAAVLGTPVVAEGVETPEQARFLLESGCALAQGYHFGRPVPPAEITRSLAADPVPQAGSTRPGR
jgi:diguanylate cyclase (GGDEF)-like protein